MRLVAQASKATQRWVARGRWSKQEGWAPLRTGPARGGSDQRISYGEREAKDILDAAGVTVPKGAVAQSADDAARIAAAVGYPVVAKVSSAQITHKSDIGGVKIGLTDEAAVREAYASIMSAVGSNAPEAMVDGVLIEAMAAAGGFEVLIGVHRDPVFGPVMTFGLGGVYIELFKDVARCMLPVTSQGARQLISEPRCSAILRGVRGRSGADVAALEKIIVAVSDFVISCGDSIEELELNPVWVGGTAEGPGDGNTKRSDHTGRDGAGGNV